MKRTWKFVAIMFAIIATGAMALPLNAASKQEKAAEKEAKKVAKQLTKEGWKLNGSGLMENSIAYHLLSLTRFGGENMELEGRAEGMKDLGMATSRCQKRAAEQYVSGERMAIKGRAVEKGDVIGEEELNNFILGYEARIAAEIQGEMKRSYSLYRKGPDGKYEVVVYYLINEDLAKRSKARALKKAAEENKISIDIANDISDFINGN